MTDDSTGTASNVSKQIEDGVESRRELNRLILDNTEGVSSSLKVSWFPVSNSIDTHPQNIIKDKIAEQVDHSLFEIFDVLQALPHLPEKS